MRFSMKTYLSVNTGLAPLTYIDAENRTMAWAIHNAILHENLSFQITKVDHLIEITDVLLDAKARAMGMYQPQVHAMWRRGGQASYDWWIRQKGEILHVPAMCAVAILVFRDGKVATVASVKRDNRRGLPAGGVEYYENPVQAAVRELREETGLSVSPLNMIFLGATLLEGRDMVGLFLAVDAKGDIKSSEEGEAAWLLPEDLLGHRSAFAQWNTWALKQYNAYLPRS